MVRLLRSFISPDQIELAWLARNQVVGKTLAVAAGLLFFSYSIFDWYLRPETFFEVLPWRIAGTLPCLACLYIFRHSEIPSWGPHFIGVVGTLVTLAVAIIFITIGQDFPAAIGSQLMVLMAVTVMAVLRTAVRIVVLMLLVVHNLALLIAQADWHDFVLANAYLVGSAMIILLVSNVTYQIFFEQCKLEAALAAQRDGLEKAVAERTREVVAAREAAEAANVAKSQFLGVISHELRTPLNGISGMATLIRHDHPTPKQIQRLDRIDECSRGLLNLIESILDVSRMDLGTSQLDESPINLQELLDESVDNIRQAIYEKGLALIIEPPPDRTELSGDAQRLRQALSNYLNNAVKFTESGSVTVRVKIEDESSVQALVRFEIQDTGIGIAPEVLDRLFAPFELADSSSTRKHRGTGIGLYLTRKLAERMGGSVGAQSSPGTGSIFWFSARLTKL